MFLHSQYDLDVKMLNFNVEKWIRRRCLQKAYLHDAILNFYDGEMDETMGFIQIRWFAWYDVEC